MSKSKNFLQVLTVDIFQDAFSLFGVPTNTLSKAFQNHLHKKMVEARDELLEAIREAKIEPKEAADNDETIAVIYRYFIAARDGAARRNLRLMAKAITRLYKEDKPLVAEFERFAPILSEIAGDVAEHRVQSHHNSVFLSKPYLGASDHAEVIRSGWRSVW